MIGVRSLFGHTVGKKLNRCWTFASFPASECNVLSADPIFQNANSNFILIPFLAAVSWSLSGFDEEPVIVVISRRCCWDGLQDNWLSRERLGSHHHG